MYQLLYSGFDQFDIAFQGALPRDVVATLEMARDEAQEQQEPVLVTVGPGSVDMHVSGHGLSGGYAFVCDTGPTGEKWFFKKGSNATDWNIFATVHSKALVSYPLEVTFARLRRTLLDIGCIVGLESINRIDFAMDFLAPPDFEPDHALFVAHRRTKMVSRYAKDGDDGENQSTAVRSGGRCESVTIGKMPGRQIIIYDKRREAIDKHKMHWFRVWGIDPKDRNKHIWRIELRAGKKHLKDRWNLRNFADVEAAIGDVFKHAMEDIRYVADHQTDSNITRQQIHPLWEKASGIALYAMREHRAGLTPDQIREVEREQILQIYIKQIIGNCAGLAVALAMTDDEIRRDLSEVIHATLANRIRYEDDSFWKSHKRAGQRLHFIG